jgi:hypothetical protein
MKEKRLASVFCLKWQYIYTFVYVFEFVNVFDFVYLYCTYVYVYVYICITCIYSSVVRIYTENGNFRLFAAIRKGKQKFVFLGQQMINRNRRMLCQQTCPSMQLCINVYQQIFIVGV